MTGEIVRAITLAAECRTGYGNKRPVDESVATSPVTDADGLGLVVSTSGVAVKMAGFGRKILGFADE